MAIAHIAELMTGLFCVGMAWIYLWRYRKKQGYRKRAEIRTIELEADHAAEFAKQDSNRLASAKSFALLEEAWERSNDG